MNEATQATTGDATIDGFMAALETKPGVKRVRDADQDDRLALLVEPEAGYDTMALATKTVESVPKTLQMYLEENNWSIVETAAYTEQARDELAGRWRVVIERDEQRDDQDFEQLADAVDAVARELEDVDDVSVGSKATLNYVSDQLRENEGDSA